ncbi:MAG: GSU2204 family CXXCH-containing (seleno)protein [Desulfuromonadales bacterium]|nr:GSU2204 family CXXCH-containing (seleno)protein [Desulfuromonadales bacterium]
MHNDWKWLLALSVVILMAPLPLLAADATAQSTGSIEVGGAIIDIKDDPTRVNKYSTSLPDDDSGVYGKINLDAAGESTSVRLDGEFHDQDSSTYQLDINAANRLRFRSSHDKFNVWLNHDRLDYLNAGIPSGGKAAATLDGLIAAGTAGYAAQPAQNGDGATVGKIWSVPDFNWLDPNNVTGYIGQGASGQLYAFNPALPYYNTATIANPPEAIKWQQVGRASLYGEDFVPNRDFFMTREEFKNSFDIQVTPNVTLHFGHRLEKREGIDQSIAMSKCTSCHITGQSKRIDEETEDLRLGATGKFGLLTVDYEYLNREFRNRTSDPLRVFDPALAPNPRTQYTTGNATFDNRLLYDYEAGAIPYDVTPESDKQSHVLKARLDLSNNTVLTGSYVNAEVESNKADSVGMTVNKSQITTQYDGYGLRLTVRPVQRLALNLRGKVEEVDTSDFSYSLPPMGTGSASLGGVPDPAYYTDLERHASNDGDKLTLGIDGLYRLGRKTTLRAGYEYEKFDRDYEELGETETQTVKLSLKTRFGKTVSARAAYSYQEIDEPLHNPHGAMYVDPVTGLPYYDKDQQTSGVIDGVWQPGFLIGSGPSYGTDFYDLRTADLSNLPESIHEVKLSSTWSPSASFAATVALRGRFEENDLTSSDWQQESYSPSVSFWYAPTDKLNLTFLYNYLGQRAESKFCQGWYDG